MQKQNRKVNAQHGQLKGIHAQGAIAHPAILRRPSFQTFPSSEQCSERDTMPHQPLTIYDMRSKLFNFVRPDGL